MISVWEVAEPAFARSCTDKIEPLFLWVLKEFLIGTSELELVLLLHFLGCGDR